MTLTLWLGAGAASAQQGELINDEAGGFIELTGQSRLLLTGLVGHVSLRVAKAGELRYEVRSLQNRRDEIPVGLWIEGKTLRIEALEEYADQRILLEASVPPQLDVVVRIDDSLLTLAGLMSDVEIEGRNLELSASGLAGDVTGNIEGGEARMGAFEGGLELSGSGLELALRQIGGPVTLSVAESSGRLEVSRSGVEIDLEESTLLLEGIQGGVRGSARGGRLEVNNATGGADLRLDGTPLRISDIEGGVIVETDAELQFRELKSDLTVTSYGGPVRGAGNVGGVQVATDGATVHLEAIQGKVRVEGQDLTVRLRELRKEATLRTSLSRLFIEDAQAALDIENDFGDIAIAKAKGPVKVTSRDGDVHINELRGPLQLSADGNEVEVSWTDLSGEENSSVVNERGDVAVRLPANGRCRVEASTDYGTIESLLPAVRVSDDGRSAAGVLGGAGKPVLRVSSGGALLIGPAEKAAASTADTPKRD